MSSTEYTRVDGSFGEGGGQILRTSAALSAVLQRPVEITSIRAKRPNPGLRPQHVAVLRAIAALCNGEVENLEAGSTTIRFLPGKVRSTNLSLDVGSAGSITLLLQPVILISSLSGADFVVELKGGTDVKWSPTLDYFRKVVLPAFKLLGVEVSMEVRRRGYYPEGGGFVETRIKGAPQVRPFHLLASPTVSPSIMSVCSNLPKHVAERQLATALSIMSDHGIKVEESHVSVDDAASPGSSIAIYSVGPSGPFIGADSVGERGKPAEEVGREAADLFVREFQSGAPVDFHLADMVVGMLALAEGESAYRTSAVTEHLRTNLHICQLLVGCQSKIEENTDGTATVRIWGVGEKP